MKLFFSFLTSILFIFNSIAQTNPAIQKFISPSYLSGASVSICVKEIGSGNILYSYDADREVAPASVMKIVTTATALEILGENYRFETSILYDGNIENGVLKGNLYIRGGGDPSIGSRELGGDRDAVLKDWINAIKKLNINKITGAVIADESIFDTEGISMKWMREDLGSYYGQGCYGLNYFDNRYTLFMKTGQVGAKPEVIATEPNMKDIVFKNYLKSAKVSSDSIYIVGVPYDNERYLYGVVPTDKSKLKLEGDIPEPALFLAQYFTEMLQKANITVSEKATCYRILSQKGRWNPQNLKLLTTTYSRPLKELVKITNRMSSNLFADTFLKTIGLRYQTGETISSFGKGVQMVQKHWKEKGIDVSSLWMYDGSGLAPTDRVTAKILCDILSYMAAKSSHSSIFVESIPKAGLEGTVQNMLKNTKLQGNIRLKSGSMSRVLCYAGYVTKDGKTYTVAVLVNNFSGKQSQIKKDIEQLFLTLF